MTIDLLIDLALTGLQTYNKIKKSVNESKTLTTEEKELFNQRIEEAKANLPEWK